MSLGSKVFFISFITIHLAAAVIPIRNWPLTDYPMFSNPVEEFKVISRLSLEDVYKDKSVTWTHSDYASVGLNDARLQLYVSDINHPRVFQLIADKVRRRSGKYLEQKPEAIRIVKTDVGPDENGNLQTTKEVLREINFSEFTK